MGSHAVFDAMRAMFRFIFLVKRVRLELGLPQMTFNAEIATKSVLHRSYAQAQKRFFTSFGIRVAPPS